MKAALPRSFVWLAAGALVATTWSAVAREVAPEPVVAAPAPAPIEVRCRLFARPLETDVLLESHDGSTEVGQWVLAQSNEGWSFHGVELEIAQKPTGYPQGWAHVCLRRERR